MNQDKFTKMIESRHKTCLSTLALKATIYAPQDDRLSNFKGVADMNQTTPQKALWGMVSKHIIAVKDMVNVSEDIPSDEWIKDYLGDIHNYVYLLEAIWEEKK